MTRVRASRPSRTRPRLTATEVQRRTPRTWIAEIISRFDLVAIQEVKADLEALRRVCAMLGAWWDYVVTDVTEGTAGNGERLAYLYDSRKVKFSGMIGEVVLPPSKVKGVAQPAEQLARTPQVRGFKAGWYRFELCTVHVYYGESKALDPRRVREIQPLAKRAKKKEASSDNLVVLGDFNIFARTDATYTALTDAGFVIPKELGSIPGSNVPKNKHYDQIAFLQQRHEPSTTGKAGVFDFFETVCTTACTRRSRSTRSPCRISPAWSARWRPFAARGRTMPSCCPSGSSSGRSMSRPCATSARFRSSGSCRSSIRARSATSASASCAATVRSST